MRRRACLAGAAAAALTGRLGARSSPTPAIAASLVRTGLYRLAGPGGNTLVRFSNAGMLLVDGQPADAYGPLTAALRRLNRIADLPIRAVALTSHASRQMGTVAQWLGQGVDVVVQRQAAGRLPPAVPVPGRTPGQVVAFDAEQGLHLGAVLARALHVGPARTAADTVVHFADLRVLAIGDLYTRDAPSIDADAGGAMAGWLHAIDRILDLDADLIVPGEGELVSPAELLQFQHRLRRGGD